MELEERNNLIQRLIVEGQQKPNSLLTIMFDEEDEYVKFVRDVYRRYDGEGLEFSNVPIILSTRIKPLLLQRTWEEFDFRPVTQEDLDKVRQELRKWKPWDPEMIKDKHVPGFKGGVKYGRI